MLSLNNHLILVKNLQTFRDPKIKLFDPYDTTILAQKKHDFNVELDFELMDIEQDIYTNDEVPEEIKLMLEQHEDRRTPNIEDTETINLGTVNEPKEVKISIGLDKRQMTEFIELLRAYKDVFAWSYEDMPGLNTDIVQHHLPTDPSKQPVKQKLRRLKPEWSLKVKEKVMKQFNAGFVRPVPVIFEYLE